MEKEKFQLHRRTPNFPLVLFWAYYLLNLSLMQDLLGYSGLLTSLTYGLFICYFVSAVHALYKYVWFHLPFIWVRTNAYGYPHVETTEQPELCFLYRLNHENPLRKG